MKDKEIERLIKAEEKRQKSVINLIPSENYVSDDILRALGSVLNNKYSEGYPGARYYGGNAIIDKIEELCRKRALKLFKLDLNQWHANVQPLSGSPANFAVYSALVPIGGKIMGLLLSSGGHLTHGQKMSMTGKIWKQVPYEVDSKTETLDYEALKKLAMEEKPNIIVAGYTAYPRFVDWKKFREIADASGAILMVDMSHMAGLVAGGVYPSPFPYADVVTTTTHKTLRGPRAAIIFARKDERSFDKKIDKAIIPGLQGGPHENAIAAVAVCLKEAMSPAFKKYAKQIVANAKMLTQELRKHGWRIISGGTDSHLLLVDTWMGGKGLSGRDAEMALEKGGIIVNKNTIPGDPRGPLDPSGIRLGTPAVTTQGMKEKDMIKIAQKIKSALKEEISRSKRKIRLAVLKVGDDPVTAKYLEVKKKFAEAIGVDVRIYEVPVDISNNKLRERLSEIVHIEENDGVIVQLPMPAGINMQYILDAITLEKDPDMLSSKSWGKFSTGKSKIFPPVVGAIKTIFDENKTELKGKNAVVVGAGRLVGKPVAAWLIGEGTTVSVIDENTKNPEDYTKKADIIISGVGKPRLIKADMVRDGVVAIDCGTSESSGTVSGDIDLDVSKKASTFAPVPGGVGPITIAMLFRNLIELSK